MQKQNVVILTGGLGTRLHKYTANLYPKILISLGNETMLDRMIRYYDGKDIESFTIVASSYENSKIITSYIHAYHIRFAQQYNFKIILYPKLDGSFMTIYKTFRGMGTKNMVLHWSDVLPLQDDVFKDCMDSQLAVATDNNPRHRINIDLTLEPNIQTYTVDGNIAGYFFVKDFDNVFNKTVFEEIVNKYRSPNTEIDFTDALKHITGKKCHSIATIPTDFIDIGDSEKYEKFMSNVPLDTRSFNTIEFLENRVIKKPLNKIGEKLMKCEFGWYENMINEIENLPIPNLFANSSECYLNMEKIKGVTVDQYLQENNRVEDVTNIIKLFNKNISIFHNHQPTTLATNLRTCKKEYLNVTQSRLEEIDFILTAEIDSIELNTFCKKETYHFKDLDNDYILLVDEAVDYIMDKYDGDYGANKYATIHGDTNTSNVMVNDSGTEMYFIDPRGSFGGDNVMRGDIHYDWAKFIYGLQGYARFSTDQSFQLVFDDDLNRLHLDISHYQVDNIDNILDIVKTIRPDLDTKVLRLLVGIIHIKLGQYIKNNLSKTIATIQYGRYLIETTLYEN